MAEEVRGPLQLLDKPLWSTIIRPLAAANTFRDSNPAKSDDLLWNLLEPSIVLQVTLVVDRGMAQLNKLFGSSKHAGRLFTASMPTQILRFK